MTAQTGLAVSRDGSNNGTTPKGFRLALGGMLAGQGSSGTDVRKGVLWDGAGAVVSGTAGMSYSIRACRVVVMPSAAQGPIIVTNDAALSVATDAAPGSNSRIDIIWVRQHLVAADGGADSDVVTEFGVAKGTAAASPSAPSIPSGAVELARATVTSGTTATNSLTVSQTHLWTAAAGAPVPVRNDTERSALAFDGSLVSHLGSDKLQRYDGAAWKTLSDVLIAKGIDSGSPASADSVTVPITFGTTFPSAPVVQVTLKGGASVANLIRASVSNETTTGCDVTLYRSSGSTSSISFGWTAIG